MIVVRRIFAVFMGLFLLVSFGGYLVVDRVATAALDPQFLKDELVRLDVYEFVYDDLLRLAVDEALSEQNEWLPDNFGAVELPSDDQMYRVLDRLLRDVFPPRFLQDVVEHVLDQFLPYITGETDSFRITLSLGDRVKYALLGDPSPLQRALDELGIARMLVQGAIATYEAQLIDAGVDVDEARARLDELGIDTEEATEWLEENLFTVIDDIRPFLTGEADSFDAQVLFDEQPALTEILANLLGKTPEELKADGFNYSSFDFQQAIDGLGGDEDDGGAAGGGSNNRAPSGGGAPTAGPDPTDAFANQLDFLRQDFVWTSDDFVAELTADGATTREDIDAVRTNLGRVRTLARWGSLAAVISLAVSIGFMGGRGWAGRLLWGAGSLLIVSTIWFAATGPVYAQFGEDRLHDELVKTTESWPESIDSASVSFVEKVEAVADSVADGFRTRALQALIVSLALTAGAIGWMYWPRDRDAAWVAQASGSEQASDLGGSTDEDTSD